jgi:alpha-tubulin suppressor-like RCC1 family protein
MGVVALIVYRLPPPPRLTHPTHKSFQSCVFQRCSRRYNPISKPPTNRVDFVSVACGLQHSIALSADGKLWGWGSNEFEQLAVRRATAITITTALFPSQPLPLPPLYSPHTLHQLPNPKASKDFRKQPDLIHFPHTKNPFVFVAAGHQHSLAIAQESGRKDILWSWGQNANGQCGHGKKSPSAQVITPNIITNIQFHPCLSAACRQS